MNAILYAAKKKLTPTHYRVIAWRDDVTHEEIWVRAVIDKSGKCLADLAVFAKPRRGETVLNSIEL